MPDPAKSPRENETLWSLCVEHGRPLDSPTLDGARLLWAIAGCESNWGRLRLFARHESAYMPGGRYHQAQHMRQLWNAYGVIAASSMGTWQVLPVTAWELGFRGHPIELQDDPICARWAAALIARRIIARQGARTVAQILDAYNTGTHRDRNVPEAYVAKGSAFYESTHPEDI